ncbi:hypothetical protein INT44_006386, partial [Umbelopsis vinacea]
PMQLKIQEVSSNAPIAVAYIPTPVYTQLKDRKNVETWVQITDKSSKQTFYCHALPSNQASDTVNISRYIQAPDTGGGSPGSVGIIESIQDGIELNIVCELKENVDELEQKRRLGFIWDEASELERLLAVRNMLDGMVVVAGCIIVPATAPIKISAGTKISIKDDIGAFQETADSGIDQLVSSMSNLSLARLKQKKNAFGMSGLEKAYDALLEVVSYPLLYNDVITALNIECPKGVLLYGPPGVGKTYLVASIAKVCGAEMIVIQGPEIFGPYIGESEEKLRNKFKEAALCSEQKKVPVILFIDEIVGFFHYYPPSLVSSHSLTNCLHCCTKDALTPNRQNAQSHESRVVAQLLTLMDGMENRGRTVVIGATNRPNSLDPALRRPGRFDREILIDAPNENARLHILRSQLKKVPVLNEDDVLAKLAVMTNGYVAADLMALCREATMVAIEHYMQLQGGSQDDNRELSVTIDDFAASMSKVGPSIQRGYETVVEKKGWDDIGGLEDVKKKIKQATEWPLLHKETFKRLGLKPPRGILLFGPPGCSKTTLVKVIASVSGATFLSINGAQIYSPFVGDSEKIIRSTFQKARSAAPSVIFLDEIEAIVGKRNLGSGGSGSDSVQERVLSTLLNEMDGVELASSVLVIGATNRPDMLDAALMRPGRFDKIIYVPPPDFVSRQQILQVHTKDIPLAEDVDLEEIADRTNLYTGADLQNLCREAAMIGLRQNRSASSVVCFQNDGNNICKGQHSC